MERGDKFTQWTPLRGGHCIAKATSGLKMFCWVITTWLRCYKLKYKEQNLLLLFQRTWKPNVSGWCLGWMSQPGQPGESRVKSKAFPNMMLVTKLAGEGRWVFITPAPLHTLPKSQQQSCLLNMIPNSSPASTVWGKALPSGRTRWLIKCQGHSQDWLMNNSRDGSASNHYFILVNLVCVGKADLAGHFFRQTQAVWVGKENKDSEGG